MASVPHMKRAIGPAEVYASSEVEAISTAPRQPRSRPMTPLRAKYIRDHYEPNTSGTGVDIGYDPKDPWAHIAWKYLVDILILIIALRALRAYL
jgi:hypothetical protein